MKKYILAACLAAISSISAFAQTDDYKKGEVYVGYSNNQIDSGADSGDTVESFFDDRESFNGFEAAGVYNVSKYFGVKGDISGTYKNQNINVPFAVGTTTGNVRFDVNRSVYNFLGGVQVKNNSNEGRVKPFAHALIGAGHVRAKVKNLTCSNITPCPIFSESNSETGLAGAFGGGLDIKATNKISIRAFQVDYNPIRINGDTSHNIRLGAGIVF
jgi:hypothetical protein